MAPYRYAFRTALLLSMGFLLCWDVASAQRSRVVSIEGGSAIVLPPAPAEADAVGRLDEIEPNNEPAAAQVLQGASPLTINGNAEVADVGGLGIRFNNGVGDDLEDLFLVTTTAVGLNLLLDGFAPTDCDLYIFVPDGETFNMLGASFNNSPEIIDLPDLAAGTYFVAVAIFDPFPGGASSPYALTLTGAVATPVEAVADVPAAFALEQNYPNPFNPQTRIRYDLPTGTPVRLEIFNVLGRIVRTLVDAPQAAGTHTALWDGTTDGGIPAATGVYVYRLSAGALSQARTLVLLR